MPKGPRAFRANHAEGAGSSLERLREFLPNSLTFGTPLVGHLADRYGRLRIMVPTVIVLMFSVIPLFLWVIQAKSFMVLVLVMAVLGLLRAAYFGALPSVMSDAFDPMSRATGLSFSYNTAVVAFGGFTAMMATFLIQQTGQPLAPATTSQWWR